MPQQPAEATGKTKLWAIQILENSYEEECKECYYCVEVPYFTFHACITGMYEAAR
jgi:hypothetical protein